MKDSYILRLIKITSDECQLYRSRLKEGVSSFLRQLTMNYLNLAMNYLNEEGTKIIIRRLKEETNAKTGTLQLPLRERDYLPKVIILFSNGLFSILSSLNVSMASSGYKKEWKVGNRKKYDQFDD